MSADNEPKAPRPSSPFRWFPEFWELSRKRLRPQARLLGLSLLVGVIAGLGGVVFLVACQVVVRYSLDELANYHPRGPGGEPAIFQEGEGEGDFRPWLLLIIPTVGGIFSGFIVYTLAPEAEGHGTDGAIDAYHNRQGRIRPIVPVVKILASAITLGTGGSGGREGPIAQIGAGFGSFLGGLLKLRPADRRVLLAAGMGAGVGAIFRAPLAGALFASEVLYRSPDFESEVIMPAGLASVIAYCTFGLFFGWDPLFTLAPELNRALTFDNPVHLISYTFLALLVTVLAMFYTRSFYSFTFLFRRLPLRPHFKPAIGAFLTGLVGFGLYHLFNKDQQVLAVMSTGYGILQDAMRFDNEPSLRFALVLLAVAFGKMLTTGLTIGSGGSGGVFGPSMVIGGCGGGAFGMFLNWLSPELAPHPAKFVIIGMAGFFAAAAKTPFSTLVIVSEMTGNYNLLLPTLWVCAIAFLLSDEQSIYSSQVESRSRSPAHQGDYVREVLADLRVKQFVIDGQQLPIIRAGDRLADIIERLSRTDFHALPVTDDDGRLLGVVSLEEVHLASQSPNLVTIIVAADLMRSDVTPLHPDHRLDRAVELFVENDLVALPVVEGAPEKRVIGIVKRSDIAAAYLRHVQGMPAARDGSL